LAKCDAGDKPAITRWIAGPSTLAQGVSRGGFARPSRRTFKEWLDMLAQALVDGLNTRPSRIRSSFGWSRSFTASFTRCGECGRCQFATRSSQINQNQPDEGARKLL
jgi:hypothetical protein